MTYHSHKLYSVSHSHIIGRTDPITGDIINENDTIVFCLNCHSCFLEESWNYMDNAHCQQNQTLKFIPFPPPQLIVTKKEQKLIAELTDSSINPFPFIITTIAFSCYSCFFMGLNEITSLIIGIMSGIAIEIIIKTKRVKEIAGIKAKGIRIYENYLELENVKFFWNDIEQINFKRTMLVEFDDRYGTEKVSSYTPSLEIHFKNGEHLKRYLPTKNYHTMKPFLFGLAWASQFVSIHFYTEHEKEYGLIKSFDRNYQGNIEIGEPTQLVYNPEEN